MVFFLLLLLLLIKGLCSYTPTYLSSLCFKWTVTKGCVLLATTTCAVATTSIHYFPVIRVKVKKKSEKLYFLYSFLPPHPSAFVLAKPHSLTRFYFRYSIEPKVIGKRVLNLVDCERAVKREGEGKNVMCSILAFNPYTTVYTLFHTFQYSLLCRWSGLFSLFFSTFVWNCFLPYAHIRVTLSLSYTHTLPMSLRVHKRKLLFISFSICPCFGCGNVCFRDNCTWIDDHQHQALPVIMVE